MVNSLNTHYPFDTFKAMNPICQIAEPTQLDVFNYQIQIKILHEYFSIKPERTP